MLNYFSGTSLYHFSNDDIKKINQLVKEKYSGWEWNYGCSPRYIMKKKIIAGENKITVEFTVSKGIIENFRIDDPEQFGDDVIEKICTAVTGLQHKETSLVKKLSEFQKSSFFQSISIADFVHLLF